VHRLRFVPRDGTGQFHAQTRTAGFSYVYKQPTTPDEETLCKEAMEGCPVEAIGNDGAQTSEATPRNKTPQQQA